MQIKKLEYYDNEYKWKLEAVEFLPNLNLLVGISGAGKTRILDAIYNLKSIAGGKSIHGIKWNIEFIADNNINYRWSGEFESKKNIPIDRRSGDNEKAKILFERLIVDNNEILIERKGLEIIFNGVKTPKLSPFESAIEILKQEEKISPVKESLDKIIIPSKLSNSEVFGEVCRLPTSILEKIEYLSLSDFQSSDLTMPLKIAILEKVFPEEFGKIKASFISIFPRISDIKIDTIEDDDIPDVLFEKRKGNKKNGIKEKGVECWIQDISSGMLKALMYISELHLSPDNSVILIDEFENSLGVNCLDSMTKLVLENKKLQFIVTSHHPYIINNISPAYWRIVTRKAGIVTVKNAKDFHISESRQKAFIDLINILEDEEDLEG